MCLIHSLCACGFHACAGHGGSDAGRDGEEETRARRGGEKEEGQNPRPMVLCSEPRCTVSGRIILKDLAGMILRLGG